PDELAVGAAEIMRSERSDDENTKYPVLDRQRRCNERAQIAACETLRKRKGYVANIRFIYQFAPDATEQSILIDGNARLICHRQSLRQALTLASDTADGKHVIGRVVETDTPKIYRKVVFQTSDHHLKYASQILALRCCAS